MPTKGWVAALSAVVCCLPFAGAAALLTRCLFHPPAAVDIWSGNHPFYQGVTHSVVTDEGRVNKFKRRFAGLDSLSKVETAADAMAAVKKAAAK